MFDSGLIECSLFQYLESLENAIVSDPTIENEENYRLLIKALYKKMKFDRLVERSMQMSALYRKTVYPLEWICRVYLELNDSPEESETFAKIDDVILVVTDQIIDLHPNSGLGHIAKGLKLTKSNKFDEGKLALQHGII